MVFGSLGGGESIGPDGEWLPAPPPKTFFKETTRIQDFGPRTRNQDSEPRLRTTPATPFAQARWGILDMYLATYAHYQYEYILYIYIYIKQVASHTTSFVNFLLLPLLESVSGASSVVFGLYRGGLGRLEGFLGRLGAICEILGGVFQRSWDGQGGQDLRAHAQGTV